MTHRNNIEKNKSKKRKYKKRLPLKYKLFLCLFALCIFTISLLWIFQTVLLDDFYYAITVHTLSDSADGYTSLSSNNLQSYTDAVSSKENISAVICTENGETIAKTSDSPLGVIRNFSADRLISIYKEAKQNGGEYIFTFNFLDIALPSSNEQKENTLPDIPDAPNGIALPQKPQSNNTFKETQGSNDESYKRLIYSKIVNTNEGESVLVLFDCSLSPVGTVKDTITLQLIIVSATVVLLSAVIALIFSYTVSKPISKISRSAKELARGYYGAEFCGGGCREIEELSMTLSYASEELSKLEGLQNELISNISHDLRTPLTMINGYAEVMRDIPGENTPENVQVIIDETKRLSSLVNNLLEISRVQKNAKVLNSAEFSLSELLRETVDRFDRLNRSLGYSVILDCSEEVFVLADREKISQVLYNLIGNAINYTGEDKKVIITQTASEDIVRIDVYDSGNGIEAEKLPHIWQRFYRADAYHKRSELGMGLGLSIVKDILDAHKAAYGVNSKLGCGSDFWFKLHRIKSQDHQ